MEPDSRNRVSGTSSHKKRRFGRKKKCKAKARDRDSKGIFASAGLTLPSRASTSAPSTSFDTERPSIITQPSTSGISRSAMKINTTPVSVVASNVKNRIIDISILFPELKNFLVCKSCHGSVNFSEVDARGLGSQITVTCSKCHQAAFIDSSEKLGKQSNAYEINKRSVLAARMIGQGLAGLKTFCGIMDLPQPVSHSNFDNINKDLQIASKQVATESMKAAVKEVCEINSIEDDKTVSGDGSWRKRGHSSLQGFSSLILYETGKIIDVAPKQSFCKACDQHPEEDTETYREWWSKHEPLCSANHFGNSGKMEVDGILEMFQRSEALHGVKYKNYIGDGDSKVFKTVCEANPYGDDFQVQKKECVGHVQKRMGTRLRNLKSSFSGKVCTDGQSIGGRGRLTAQVIDDLTRYYGNAIRRHKDSAEDMYNSIWATFYHKMSTDQKPQHHLCPPGVNSWCKWQKAKATSKKALKNFRHTNSIPPAIMEAIKPIYTDLTNNDLLEKCVGGYTQNSNESFNNYVWKLLPKTLFSGLTVFQIGVYIAVLCFNNGKTSLLQLMKTLGLKPGTAAIQWSNSADEERIYHSDRRTKAATLEARQARRKRSYPDDNSYVAGGH